MDNKLIFKNVFKSEIAGLNHVCNKIEKNEKLDSLIDVIIKNSKSRVVVCGMGKSGIIAKKISASLSSTGTPSFSIHPGEAFHGDLGMIMPSDIFIAISNSGETDELLKLLPFLNDNKNLIISMTGNVNSTLAKNSHYVLDISVPEEACPYQLAPTTSTTATLVMGDALTIALMEARNFTPESFARFHPGGALGRKLLSTVKDEMEKVPLPRIAHTAGFTDIVDAITSGKLGFVIVDTPEQPPSIITDGDLRRAMAKYQKDVFLINAGSISTKNPKTVQMSAKTQYAYDLMNKNNISLLLVLNDQDELISVLKK